MKVNSDNDAKQKYEHKLKEQPLILHTSYSFNMKKSSPLLNDLAFH